jgi:predicted dehydrogenase
VESSLQRLRAVVHAVPAGRSPVLKVALVGCGKAGENHVRAIRKLPGVSLVAVCDAERLMAEQLAVRYGIRKHFFNVDEMLDAERPDVVHITTPPQSHLSLAVKALDARCHVFVEKPLTLCYADSQKLVAHAMTRNRKLTIGYSYCFDPVARALRTLMADGVVGEPVHVESFFGYSFSGTFGSCVFADREHWVNQLPGKLVHNVIDHVLNKVVEFVGERATVHVQAWQRGSERDPTFNMPDEVRVILVDTSVSAFATFTSHARPVAHFLNVYGTKSTVRLDFDIGTITLAPTTALPGALGRLSRTFGGGLQYLQQGTTNVVRFVRGEYHTLAGLDFLIDAFYESVRQDSAVPVPYSDILKVAAMTDVVLARLRQGEAVLV